jgi:AraC-like DNA-binding protein
VYELDNRALKMPERAYNLKGVVSLVRRAHRFGPDRMEHGTLYFSIRGKMYFQAGESLTGDCVQTNQFLWIPPHTLKACSTDETGADLYAILLEEVERNQRPATCLVHQALPGSAVVSRPSNPAYVESLFRNAEQQWLQAGAANRIEVNGLALIVIAQWLKSLSNEATIPHLEQGIRPVVEHITQNASRPDLGIAELIQLTPWSRRYFFRAFRTVTGMSPHEYIQHVRMNRALSLLAIGGLPVNDVARQCGYDDPAYFSRVFTHRVGRPPSRL